MTGGILYVLTNRDRVKQVEGLQFNAPQHFLCDQVSISFCIYWYPASKIQQSAVNATSFLSKKTWISKNFSPNTLYGLQRRQIIKYLQFLIRYILFNITPEHKIDDWNTLKRSEQLMTTDNRRKSWTEVYARHQWMSRLAVWIHSVLDKVHSDVFIFKLDE